MARTIMPAAAPRSTLDRWVAFAAFGGVAVAIISLIFTIGVYSGRINALEHDVSDLKASKAQFETALAGQDKATAIVNTRLEVIQRDVATLLGRTERQPGTTR